LRYNKFVRVWLVIGCILLFFQIFIGGVTRITGSGLSITKWEIITGAVPPLTEDSWNKEFDLYKATPQYQKINQGISLSKFKFIYFWEFLHRLWARTMGFVFLFPFIFFVAKKWLDKRMIKQLCLVIFCAALAAIFGWIMVASGLVDRPWVNAYKLSLHLGIALATLLFLLWGTFRAFDVYKISVNNRKLYRLAFWFFIALVIQIFFGAVLSGMRAALYYPSWPSLNRQFIPSVLFESNSWSLENIIEYDKDTLMPALIHVLHRNWGYFTYALGLYFSYRVFRFPLRSIFYKSNIVLIIALNLQVVLGILTLINSKITIPVFYGVAHQAVAIIILSVALFNLYIFRART